MFLDNLPIELEFIMINHEKSMGLKSKVFVVIPLAIFAAIIFGFGIYNTICKNSNLSLIDC